MAEFVGVSITSFHKHLIESIFEKLTFQCPLLPFSPTALIDGLFLQSSNENDNDEFLLSGERLNLTGL